MTSFALLLKATSPAHHEAASSNHCSPGLRCCANGYGSDSDFVVDKHEDRLTLVIRIHSVSFTLNGFNADNLHCEFTNPPTFPTNDLRCNDEETNYRMVIAPDTEGSGIQFGVDLYYDDDVAS